MSIFNSFAALAGGGAKVATYQSTTSTQNAAVGSIQFDVEGEPTSYALVCIGPSSGYFSSSTTSMYYITCAYSSDVSSSWDVTYFRGGYLQCMRVHNGAYTTSYANGVFKFTNSSSSYAFPVRGSGTGNSYKLTWVLFYTV